MDLKQYTHIISILVNHLITTRKHTDLGLIWLLNKTGTISTMVLVIMVQVYTPLFTKIIIMGLTLNLILYIK